jgi:hypothetical protein
MKFKMPPYLAHAFTSKALLVALSFWAGTATVMALRSRPQFILVGLDSNGTRLIVSESDPLLAQERVKFVKEVLFRLYNYDASNYEKQVNSAGDLMSDSGWKEEEKDAKRIALQMKDHPLRAEARLIDLRELDENNFEADLSIYVTDRLIVHEIRYRIALTIGSRSRNVDNPYAWEVTAYHENELH